MVTSGCHDDGLRYAKHVSSVSNDEALDDGREGRVCQYLNGQDAINLLSGTTQKNCYLHAARPLLFNQRRIMSDTSKHPTLWFFSAKKKELMLFGRVKSSVSQLPTREALF